VWSIDAFRHFVAIGERRAMTNFEAQRPVRPKAARLRASGWFGRAGSSLKSRGPPVV
jgi:hypothetical protein